MGLQNKQKQTGAFSFGEFVWWVGVVEDRMDPEQMGRVRVRVFGYHTEDMGEIPLNKLPWASTMLPTTSGSVSGVGSSPTGLVEGSHVFGFFADGHDAQQPIILGSLPSRPRDAAKPGVGFNDQEALYPIQSLYTPDAEPDCSLQARGKKTDKTSIHWRRDNEQRACEAAFGRWWKERTTPYDSRYPFNHVRETEAGVVEELDDTEDRERWSVWHPSGTFMEMHEDGSMVRQVKRDNYELIYGDDFVNIKGLCAITIEGRDDEEPPPKKGKGKIDREVKPNKPKSNQKSHNIALSVRIKGNVHLEVDGSVREHIKGDYKLNVDGDYKIECKKKWQTKADESQKHEAPLIHLNPDDYVRIKDKGDSPEAPYTPPESKGGVGGPPPGRGKDPKPNVNKQKIDSGPFWENKLEDFTQKETKRPKGGHNPKRLTRFKTRDEQS